MADLLALDRKIDMLLARVTTDQRFMSLAGAARYSGISVESVRRMVTSGLLTPLRPVAGRVVVDRQQLDAVILATADSHRASP